MRDGIRQAGPDYGRRALAVAKGPLTEPSYGAGETTPTPITNAMWGPITAAAVAWGFGSWVQLWAAGAQGPNELVMYGIWLANYSGWGGTVVCAQLGYGTAGAETMFCEFRMVGDQLSPSFVKREFSNGAPRIPGGARVAMRIASNTVSVGVQVRRLLVARRI